jgi:hypothetical protein
LHWYCRQKALVGSQKSFWRSIVGDELDAPFAYSTFTTAMKGTPPTADALMAMIRAVGAFRLKHGIDQPTVLREYQAAHGGVRRKANAAPTISDSISGAWFLIQHRAKRNHFDEGVPAADFRVAVMIYGPDNEKGRFFQIIGGSTAWQGHLNLRERHYVFVADQVNDLLHDETLTMMFVEPFQGFGPQHGIILGVAYAEHDNPNYPVYASRALLFPIQGSYRSLAALIDEDTRQQLLAACRHITGEEFSHATRPEADDQSLLAQRYRAIEEFVGRAPKGGPANYGDRIFVRR